MSRDYGGFTNPGGGNRGEVSLDALLRRIQTLEKAHRDYRPDGLIVITGGGGTSGAYTCIQATGKAAAAGGSSTYYGMGVTTGSYTAYNTLQSGTFGTTVPMGIMLPATRRRDGNGNDVFFFQYMQPGGSNGIGIGGGPGGPGGGGTGDGGVPGGPGPGDPGSGGAPTLKLNYSVLYDLRLCPDPMYLDPEGPLGARCDTDEATNTWVPNGDCTADYEQETGLPCNPAGTGYFDVDPSTFPPPPDVPSDPPPSEDCSCT